MGSSKKDKKPKEKKKHKRRSQDRSRSRSRDRRHKRDRKRDADHNGAEPESKRRREHADNGDDYKVLILYSLKFRKIHAYLKMVERARCFIRHFIKLKVSMLFFSRNPIDQELIVHHQGQMLKKKTKKVKLLQVNLQVCSLFYAWDT